MVKHLLLLMMVVIPAPLSAQDAGGTTRLAIHHRIIVKVPRMKSREQPMTPTRWKEKKGPDCVTVANVGGAIVHDDAVDLVLTGGERVRVKLVGQCPALSFYSGLYLKPGADGMMCKGRDTIRSRAGDACRVDSIRRLVARR